MNTLIHLCKVLGLHPLVGFGMFAVDWMLFGGEIFSAGMLEIISIIIAVLLTIQCILIQKYSFGDIWGAAIGKGMIVGILTAIPTALPSVIPLGGGIIGLLAGSRQNP